MTSGAIQVDNVNVRDVTVACVGADHAEVTKLRQAMLSCTVENKTKEAQLQALYERLGRGTDFDRVDADRQLRDTARQSIEPTGAVVVDTYPLFGPGDLADDFIIFPGDLHPNARAHDRIGTLLASEIAARAKP